MDSGSRGLVTRVGDRVRALLQYIEPGPRAWTGAALGLVAGTTIMLGVKVAPLFARSTAGIALGIAAGLAFAGVSGLAILLVVRILGAIPARYRFALAASLVLLPFEVYSGTLKERVSPTLYIVATSTLLGASLAVLASARRDRPSRQRVAIALVALAGGSGAAWLGARWLMRDGVPNPPAIDAAAINAGDVAELRLPDPSEPGPHRAKRLFYGSGQDFRRPEYGDRADLRTRTVDGSAFLRGWGGLDGKARTRYWGFDPRALPLNARVFYPDGEGPFPVVVVAHGGHPMDDFSEPGYDYLGEHLATHGYVFVSVDENFLNGSPWSDIAGGLANENAARGFLLLEHLRALRTFGMEPGNPLHRKVDTTRVALAGHSKGGEAIAIAALFNKLQRHPDDATVGFRFGFGIRALIALSVTDKQYQPGGASTRLTDVDFLALQGSNDGDVEYFQGMQQHDRVSFSGEGYHFKTAVFVHRANHGQWNRVWGRHDKTRFPKRLYFNRKPILPPAAQERVAKTYVTAFLAASVQGDTRYLPFLKDHRAGRRWLPDTIFITRFDDSTRRYVARFEEDVDVTTTSLPGGAVRAENLTVWREQPPGLSAHHAALETRAAYVGWDASNGKTASYTIELPASLDPTVLDPTSSLVLALADANEPPNPRRRGPPRKGPRPPIDLTVELYDRDGRVARLPLSTARLVQAELDPIVWKSGAERHDMVLQTFELPLSWFADENVDLVVGDLAAVRLVFDRTNAGVVVIDDVGFAPAAPDAR